MWKNKGILFSGPRVFAEYYVLYVINKINTHAVPMTALELGRISPILLM